MSPLWGCLPALSCRQHGFLVYPLMQHLHRPCWAAEAVLGFSLLQASPAAQGRERCSARSAGPQRAALRRNPCRPGDTADTTMISPPRVSPAGSAVGHQSPGTNMDEKPSRSVSQSRARTQEHNQVGTREKGPEPTLAGCRGMGTGVSEERAQG